MDGESHVVHVEEQAAGSRLTIGTLTVLAAREADPSVLLATSPGKLVRHLVAAGSHLRQDQPYAEVEVRPGSPADRWQQQQHLPHRLQPAW